MQKQIFFKAKNTLHLLFIDFQYFLQKTSEVFLISKIINLTLHPE